MLKAPKRLVLAQVMTIVVFCDNFLKTFFVVGGVSALPTFAVKD